MKYLIICAFILCGCSNTAYNKPYMVTDSMIKAKAQKKPVREEKSK